MLLFLGLKTFKGNKFTRMPLLFDFTCLLGACFGPELPLLPRRRLLATPNKLDDVQQEYWG